MVFHGILTGYLVVMIDIAMENHHFFLGKAPIFIAIFHSYVSHYHRVVLAISEKRHQTQDGVRIQAPSKPVFQGDDLADDFAACI